MRTDLHGAGSKGSRPGAVAAPPDRRGRSDMRRHSDLRRPQPPRRPRLPGLGRAAVLPLPRARGDAVGGPAAPAGTAGADVRSGPVGAIRQTPGGSCVPASATAWAGRGCALPACLRQVGESTLCRARTVSRRDGPARHTAPKPRRKVTPETVHRCGAPTRRKRTPRARSGRGGRRHRRLSGRRRWQPRRPARQPAQGAKADPAGRCGPLRRRRDGRRRRTGAGSGPSGRRGTPPRADRVPAGRH